MKLELEGVPFLIWAQQILDGAKALGISYSMTSRDSKMGNELQLKCMVEMVRSLNVPTRFNIAYLHPKNYIDINVSYLFGCPVDIVETIPIMSSDQSKIEVYKGLGFVVVPPLPVTYGITNSNPAFIVLKETVCPLFGGVLKPQLTFGSDGFHAKINKMVEEQKERDARRQQEQERINRFKVAKPVKPTPINQITAQKIVDGYRKKYGGLAINVNYETPVITLDEIP